MNRDKLRIVVEEAERFLQRVKALPEPYTEGRWDVSYFPKEQGAIKRSSMDLTRALANLRRPD